MQLVSYIFNDFLTSNCIWVANLDRSYLMLVFKRKFRSRCLSRARYIKQVHTQILWKGMEETACAVVTPCRLPLFINISLHLDMSEQIYEQFRYIYCFRKIHVDATNKISTPRRLQSRTNFLIRKQFGNSGCLFVFVRLSRRENEKFHFHCFSSICVVGLWTYSSSRDRLITNNGTPQEQKTVDLNSIIKLLLHDTINSVYYK